MGRGDSCGKRKKTAWAGVSGRKFFSESGKDQSDGDSLRTQYHLYGGDAGASLASVSVDDFKESYKMTEYLIGLGHKKIAFITAPKMMPVSESCV